jgi:Ubiquinol-cytochrome C reductase complex 14kD subunit
MKRRADDLLPEENDTMQLALKRLPPKEAYDRVYRLRRAFQVPARPLHGKPRCFLTFQTIGFVITSIATAR